MGYRVELRPRARRSVARLETTLRRRVEAAFTVLANDPRPRASIKLSGLDLYRVPVGDHRIVYRIDDGVLLVLVIAVAHRREVYRDLH